MFQYATEGVKLRTKIQDMIDTVYIYGYFTLHKTDEFCHQDVETLLM